MGGNVIRVKDTVKVSVTADARVNVRVKIKTRYVVLKMC